MLISAIGQAIRSELWVGGEDTGLMVCGDGWGSGRGHLKRGAAEQE